MRPAAADAAPKESAPADAAGPAKTSAEAAEDDEYYYYDDDDELVEGGEANDAWRACAAPVEAGYWKARTEVLVERLKAAGAAAHGSVTADN